MLANIGGFVSHTSNLVTKNSKQTEESKFGMKKWRKTGKKPYRKNLKI